jgi:hypothetical protein
MLAVQPTVRGALAVVALLAVLIAVPASASADDPATLMYEGANVDVIELGLTPTEQAKLEAEPEEYVKGTLSLKTTDGTPGGEETLVTPTPVKAEIRLKGSTSFEPLSGKASFKIKFKKTERFLGLRKMTLNNMVQDPSMIHEALAYAAFRAVGVPASRTGFADVKVNGEDFGIELNVETLDADFLEKQFGSFDEATQHLYEGEDGHDVTLGGATAFQVDEGEEDNIADLEALIGAVNSEGPGPWSTRVSPFAELGEMTRMWAVEKYVGQWDGYSGLVGESQPNNYYLYSEPTGRFQMLPSGLDETWQDYHHLLFDGPAGLLFDRCLADSACAATYWHSLDAATGVIGGLGLDSYAAELAELLEPWQEEEQGLPRHHFSLAQIEDAVAETRDYIAARPAEAEAWLAANVPPAPAAPESAPPAESAPAGSTSEAAEVVRLRGPRLRGRFLLTFLRLSAPAIVSQRATIMTPHGPMTVCLRAPHERPAGEQSLGCRLDLAALAKRRGRALGITIVTRIKPSTGAAKVITRRVTLPRG